MPTPLTIPEALFGKARRNVLGLLFANSSRAFYTREIVAAAVAGGSQVQKELDNLHRAGLILREKRANLVYYQANPASPVFAELKGLAVKTFGLADVVKDALQKHRRKIQFAFIFGSVAKGEDHAASDIDLFIVGDVLLSQIGTALDRAEQGLGRTVAATIMSQAEFMKRSRAKEHFVTSVLAGPRIDLFGDPATVSKAGG
jgi:predicted nucleotidyltransferase